MHRERFRWALLVAVGLALLWWGWALWWHGAVSNGVFGGVPPWWDQRETFTQAAFHLGDPYALIWPYVPWTALFMAPFGWLPVSLAVLAQLIILFGGLTALIYKYDGGFWAVVITLTSALAFDSAIELNLEWIVVLGLLLPREWSGPFLLVKPQAALGYWFGFKWRDLVYGTLVTLLVMVVSFVLWPGWPLAMWEKIQIYTLANSGVKVNISLTKGLTAWVSYPLGAVLAYFAVRRKDVVLGILAWQFFVPYATLYGYLLVLALVASRWWWAALLVSAALWIPYSRILLLIFA